MCTLTFSISLPPLFYQGITLSLPCFIIYPQCFCNAFTSDVTAQLNDRERGGALDTKNPNLYYFHSKASLFTGAVKEQPKTVSQDAVIDWHNNSNSEVLTLINSISSNGFAKENLGLVYLLLNCKWPILYAIYVSPLFDVKFCWWQFCYSLE